MSGGKGGSTTSQVEIPAWLENAAIENINRARAAQQIGYAPYYGPDVAAFTPMQTQAMQATGSAAQAFGLAPQGFDATAGIPQAQTYAGGLMGYSSAPLFEESLQAFRDVRPAQAAAMESMFIDPYGSAAGYTPMSYAPTQTQLAQTAYQERANEAAAQRAHELAMAQYQPDQSTNINVTGGTVTGGSMVMDQGPITVQTEQGPVTVDPTMGFNPVFSPDAGQQYIEVDPSMSYSPSFDPAFDPTYAPTGTVTYSDPDATVYDAAGNVVEELYYGGNAQGLNIDPTVGLTDYGFPTAGTVSYTDAPSVGGTVTYGDGVSSASNLDLSGAMTAPANTAQMQIIDPSASGALSAGEAPQDIGLMDVLKTGMNVTPMNLLSAVTTGSILSPNTDPVPVVDQTTPAVNNLPAGGVETDVVTALASQGPTGTYNQAYWAEKLASGATQAELKAEQDEIAAAGGKVYTGSTPQETTTTSASGSGK